MRRDIVGYEGLYEFDEELNVYNKKTGKSMKPYLDKDGYAIINLKQKHRKVHRLIAITFIPNPDNKPEVNHINGIRNDNRIENLQWVTRTENNRHSWTLGNQCNKGEKHPQSKLTNQIVKEIFELTELGWTQQKIADKINLHQSTISDVLRKKTWSHIEIKKPS